MAASINELNPRLLWKHFAKILTIPHCSGNEKALGEYVLGVAASLGLPGKRDKVGNVVVGKPATAGRENAVGAILQGHLDMVCEKNSDKVHDFSKDPIRTEIKGDWLYAQGTTLGADNGIGLAAALAVMEDTSLVHGPLEFLFTVDEETGLTGANKIQKGFLTGKMLLNLDSEDEGTFTIGCAGAPTRRSSCRSTGRRRPRRTFISSTFTDSAAVTPGSTSTRAAATPSSSWPACSARLSARPSSRSSASRAAANTTPSPGKRSPFWPARPSRCGP